MLKLVAALALVLGASALPRALQSKDAADPCESSFQPLPHPGARRLL